MFDTIQALLDGDEFSVVERFELPGRAARFGTIPRYLFDSRIGLHLHRQLKRDGSQLWVHQTEALEALGRGENVVVSTGTASGKSLIFRSHAFHRSLLTKGRTLVFYPLKALAADQMRGWRAMAHELELPESTVGRIDGTVPVKDREEILSQSEVVVMTPDVCHAWLMYRLALPVVRSFIQSVSTIVMDEAHTLEGVFGSNFSFLIRRLVAARDHLGTGKRNVPLQLVAATATIQNPALHLTSLTGVDFTVIDHHRDGAPRHDRVVAHVACADDGGPGVARNLHTALLAGSPDGTFITFMDSRRGVEALAMSTKSDDVLPYRAGYDADDREQIERKLQVGSLRGVVSTSALELGIDLPHLRAGLNVGVPRTRKSYRQRLGRVGRNGPAAFVVVAPPRAFVSYGTTFREYHDMSVEPSYLYLDNRFMQFVHGRCLAVERESLGAPAATPKNVVWPDGFPAMHSAARPGGSRPQEFDAIAALGGDDPHHGYPLRNVGELSFEIRTHKAAPAFGEVNQIQALRECYPGGTYLHFGKAYKVRAWRTSSFESFILVTETSPSKRTKPRIVTWVNASILEGEVLERHLSTGANGFLAECQMQITERVEGYVDGGGARHSYNELQQRDPNLRVRSRNFRTTGVVLCLDRHWFKKGALRRAFVERLRDVFVREYSISPQDVGTAWANVSVLRPDGAGVHGGCVAVFDETYGSLRLTERLYTGFDHMMDRMIAGVRSDISGDAKGEGDVSNVVPRVQEEVSSFAGSVLPSILADVPTGYDQVFAVGSVVCCRESGTMAEDVEIIQPTILRDELMYQVKFQPKKHQAPVKRWVPAHQIEPSANTDAWSYAWWNRETQEYEDPPDQTDVD